MRYKTTQYREDGMNIDEVVAFLTWLENVFPDQISFGSQHISKSEAKLSLAKHWQEIRGEKGFS